MVRRIETERKQREMDRGTERERGDETEIVCRNLFIEICVGLCLFIKDSETISCLHNLLAITF